HTSAQGNGSKRANRPSVQELNTTPTRTPQSARSVRFGNESLNAVHIIPSVATTLPFAEQMAKERETEALEASLHQRAPERNRAVPSRLLHPLKVGQTHVIEPNL
ncbi:hypothetical protein OSTOST_12638, partial [Ostertagia ostertagi]